MYSTNTIQSYKGKKLFNFVFLHLLIAEIEKLFNAYYVYNHASIVSGRRRLQKSLIIFHVFHTATQLSSLH